MPYALRYKVSVEINRLVKEGVLSPDPHFGVNHTRRTSGEEKRRHKAVCDFKVTENPATHLERYPLPKIDNIFASLYGGEVFSTLDLRIAYNQLPLDEEAQKMAVLDTHRCLYCYNRLAFGIASAPALFQ